MDTNEPTTWRVEAQRALAVLAASGQKFTADDLVAQVGMPDNGHKPNGRNNAIGSVFGEATSEKLIVAVGVTRSTTPTRKGGMVRIWQGTSS